MTEDALKAICRIPDAYYGWTRSSAQKSWRDLVAESGYEAVREQLTIAILAEHLRAHPELIQQWAQYSEDKRTFGGWYLIHEGSTWTIGRLEGSDAGIVHTSNDGPRMCGDFILRELDWYLALANGAEEHGRKPPTTGS